MRTRATITLGVGIWILLWTRVGNVQGVFFSNEYTQVAPVQERAFILFDGKRETLLVSTTFSVNPVVVGNFAWVIAVPSKPEVELVEKDIFTELEGLTQKKFSKSDLASKVIYADIKEEVSRPSEIFSRPVNIIRWEVFGPDDSLGKLERWLTEIGYFIPKSAYPVLAAYEERGWYFVTVEVSALHIQYSASDSLTVTGAHTLPVKIGFDANKIIYPLKLVAAQPDLDSADLPYSFDYGIPSESVLGDKDEVVDSLLSRQSKNKFPRLPTDMANIKLDVYVLADYKVAAPDYTTIFADKIKGDEVGLDLPSRSFFLTRMYSYKPQALLDDTTIEKSPETTRVNPRISPAERRVRISLVTAAVVIGGGYLLLKGIKAKV